MREARRRSFLPRCKPRLWRSSSIDVSWGWRSRWQQLWPATDGPRRILSEVLTRPLQTTAGMKRHPLTVGGLLAFLSMSAGIAVLLFSGCAAIQSALDIENPRYSIRNI